MSAKWIACLTIAVSAWVAHRPILDLWFTDVDTFQLILTGRVGSASELWQVLSQPLMQGRMTNAIFWRPVTSLSYGLDERIWGLSPFGFHLTDLLLHAVTSVLVFWCTLALWSLFFPGDRNSRRWVLIGASAGILFAVHPVHLETVPAIARRADILVGLFSVATVLAFARYLTEHKRIYLMGALFLCALGLLSKESGYAIPALIVSLSVTAPSDVRGRPRVVRAVKLVSPVLGLVVVVFALRTLVLGGLGGYPSANAGPLSFVQQLGLMLWKAPPSFFAGLLLPPSLVPRGLAMAYSYLPHVVILLLLLGGGVLLRSGIQFGESGAGRRSSTALFTFLMLWIGWHSLILFNAAPITRYLYPLLPAFTMLLAWGLIQLAAKRFAGGATLRDRIVRAGLLLAFSGAAFAIVGFSPALRPRAHDFWRRPSVIARSYLDALSRILPSVDPAQPLYLANVPYLLDVPPRLMKMSLPPILLEPAIEAWLELSHPELRLETIGLTYLHLEGDPEDLAVAVRFQSPLLTTNVEGSGSVSCYPWRIAYGELVDERRLYDCSPAERSKRLSVRLKPEASTGPMAVYFGGEMKLLTERSWSLERATGSARR